MNDNICKYFGIKCYNSVEESPCFYKCCIGIFWYYFHYLVPLCVILLPILPNHILKHVFYFPIFFYVVWLVYDGCPYTKLTQKDDTFIDNILEIFFPNIKHYQVHYIIGIVIAGSISISAIKLLKSCKK